MSTARFHWLTAVASAWIVALSGAAAPAARAQSVDPYHSIGLEWTATGDDSTAGRATSYQLRYSTTDPGSNVDNWWTNVATAVPGASLPAPKTSGSTDSTRVTGLASGTTYYFILRAVDDAGNVSPYSNVATSATAFCASVAGSPSGFAADTIGVSVSLTWGGAVDPNATSIRLYRGTGASGSFALYQSLGTGATSYTDNSVNPGTTYRYRLAYASVCAEGPVTATATVTLAGTPPTAGAEAGGGAVHAYPNPSKSGDQLQVVVQIEGTQSQPVRLRLFDLNGRWVADIADGVYPPGANTISWSRVGRNGQPLAPGYYELLGTAGSHKLRDRILLLP